MRPAADADSAIATDAPGDPDASMLALEHGLGLTEPLTNSETRVLHYLPTYMGVPEIAATLYLSANTVKTHVRHLYRKLGVHSRQEAVQPGCRRSPAAEMTH